MAFDPVFPEEVRIEVKLGGSGSWWYIADVLLNPAISITRGNDGTSQKDRVAQTGSMSFSVNNAEDNSLQRLGLYSPNNINTLGGWRIGIPVRCVVRYNSVDEVVFIGKIESISPDSGKYQERRVQVQCIDWMDEAARSKIRGLPIQLDQRSSDVFRLIAEAVVEQPPGGYTVDPGADVFPYALDNALEGEVNAMSEFQKIAQSELGRVYVDRNGVLNFESRQFRPNRSDIFLVMTDDDIAKLETGRGREEVINHVEVKVHPRRIDPLPTTVLYSQSNAQKIERNTTKEVRIQLRDPEERATRVGGLDMQQPQPGTDYTFNTSQDGTGADVTSQLVVTVEYSANGGILSVLNNGPSDGFLTKMECRGRGVYDYEPQVVTGDSQTSKDRYGETPFTLDMPYQSEPAVARDAADFVINQSRELLTQIRAVRFFANREDRLMRAALEGDISSKIELAETMVGDQVIVPVESAPGETELVTIDKFFVNSVQLSIGERGIIQCVWVLEPADPYTYWILEDSVLGVLGSTTRLAYGSFLLGWKLDSSVLGQNTLLLEG
jgi:hypothetical protein